MAARSLKVDTTIVPVHSDVEIETAIMNLGTEPGGGLVVMPDAFMAVHRAPIISPTIKAATKLAGGDCGQNASIATRRRPRRSAERGRRL
jgi:hypothetical protein